MGRGTREGVVAPALDVEGGEVEGDVVGLVEEALGELAVEELVGPGLLHGGHEEAAEDGVHAALAQEPLRAEEGQVQGEVAAGRGAPRLREPVDHRVHQGVPEPERRRREGIRHRRVHRLVVPRIRSWTKASICIRTSPMSNWNTDEALEVGAEDVGQPVGVGDVLHLGSDDFPGLLEELLPVPAGVDG